MNALLTRLGVDAALQEWLSPHYHDDLCGNLCFSYGDALEVYGLSFHRVPVTDNCWIAGPENLTLVRQVVISSSAMEAIAWLNCNFAAFSTIGNLLFIATGTNLADTKLNSLHNSLPGRKYILLFGNDLIGRICDLKAAALLAAYSTEIEISEDVVRITFRNNYFQMPCETFSLHAFERLSGFRFKIKTHKASRHNDWLNQLLNYGDH